MNKNIHNLARALIIDNNNILLAYNPKVKFDYYYLPGGHIEHSESSENSLLRELKEEIGNDYNFKIDRFIGTLECSFNPKNKDKLICHNHEFSFLFLVSTNLNSNEIPKSMEDHVGFIWHSIDKLNEINLLPSTLKREIPGWLKTDNNNAFKSEMHAI